MVNKAIPGGKSPQLLRLHPRDNVLIALDRLSEGSVVDGIRLLGIIPRGHKLAAAFIDKGEPIRRYGEIIGFAACSIAQGEHVHTQNCVMHDIERDYAPATESRPTSYFNDPTTFMGYVREDGRVATRNYIAVIASVNCSSGTGRYVAEIFRRNPYTGESLLDSFPNVDGVVALGHKTGCGMASEGEPIDLLRRTIAGYARHPNFGAVIMVGLGCEANQVASLLRAEGLETSDKFKTLIIQEIGGSRRTVEEGVARVKELLPLVNRTRREPVPAAHIKLALQCGGSDSFSGLTANPALGHAADLVVRHGGTAILTETTEIYGAEHLLTRRAVNPAIAQKLLDRIEWWKEYTRANGGEFDNNPSPGNKAGGLTNIVEKSLGAVVKGGSTNLVDVVRYAEPINTPGLVVMDGPGFDPVSATGQVASGANVLCFTTGRGSVFGCKPTPSLKLATNTPLYNRMPDDMDINCGGIAEGTDTVEDCGDRIFSKILAVASGEKTKSELMGFGDDEFAPWQIGATV